MICVRVDPVPNESRKSHPLRFDRESGSQVTLTHMSDQTSKPIIFLAFANDRDDTVNYLRNLPEEARQIREPLQRARRDGLCEVIEVANATADDIFRVFQDPEYRDRIAVFHYGGHANGYQLLLESASGSAHAVNAGGLAAFFGQQRGLELVFLNGCSTQQQAQGLLDANVSVVIATSRAIEDQVAMQFSRLFYQGLAGGASIQTAFKEAESGVQTLRGGNTRGLYFGDADGKPRKEAAADRWPWDLYLREGAESVANWSLPDAVGDPLFGLPPLPRQDLPDSPFRHLNWFGREHAEVFFGRGHQIRELYDLVTSAGTAPIVLLYGQSGVGKSSILAAGLIPRLEQSCEVRYLRRDQQIGLLETLRSAFVEQGTNVSMTQSMHFAQDWLEAEEQLGRPLVIILDQVEEVVTRPNPGLPQESEDLLNELEAIFGKRNRRPAGRLILSFRKEWLAEIDARLGEHKLPRAKVFLQRLGRLGVIEAVQGPTRSPRLRDHYGLTVEKSLAEFIADDLLADAESAIAPTLQILLTKTWDKAVEANREHPHFSRELYLGLKREGLLLRDFLNQQIATFHQRYPESVDSGLLLDLVALHTTPLGTAHQRSVDELQQQYAHLGGTLPALLQQCQDLHLLMVAASDQKESAKTTRLAHDTLAPLVREQFDVSDKPGQRARRILDNRSVDWAGDRNGTPLDEADLNIVEQGVGGTRVLSPTEQRLLQASRDLRDRLRRTRNVMKVVGAVALAVIVALGALNWWNHIQHERALRKSLAFALDTIDNYYKRVSDETLLNQPGMQKLRTELLADAIKDYEQILASRDQRSSDPAVRLGLAETYFRAGRISRLVDSPQDAIRYLTIALEIQQAWQEKHPDDLDRLQDLGKTWTELGTARYQIARAAETPDWNPPQEAYQQAVTRRRQVVDRNPKNAESQRLLANALMNMANIEEAQQKFDAAEQNLAEVQSIRMAQLKRDDVNPGLKALLRRDVAQGQYNLARLYDSQAKVLFDRAAVLKARNDAAAEATFEALDKKCEAAEAQARGAIQSITELLAADPLLENEFLLARAYRLLGELLSQFPDDMPKSLVELRDAEGRMAALVKGNPAVTQFRGELAEIQKLIRDLEKSDDPKH